MYETQLNGLDQLRQKMKKLDRELTDNLVRKSVSAGARAIRDRAKAIVSASDDPETGRQIANNIVSRYRKKLSQREGGVVVSVGVIYPKGRIPKGNPDDGKNTPHWFLLELGTEKMKAQPFLVPAALQEASTLPQVIVDDLSKRLDKEIAKL